MLESIRSNLKGTLVVIVIIIFVVPMVISGVGTTFLGGAGATGSAAEVNGEAINNLAVERAMRLERNQLLQMGGIDATSPLLEETNLKSSALNRLIGRSVIVTNGENNGMTVSEQQYAKMLLSEEAFLTDGKFDRQKFQALLAQSGFTAAGYRKELTEELILRQQTSGIQSSSFITDFEFAQIARLTHQKRSFYTIQIPRETFVESVAISDAEILEFYDNERQSFTVPEKVKLEYLELNLEELASQIEVDEADIIDQYEAEIANFTVSDTYTVAHILLEDSDPQEIDEITQAIAKGQAFSELAKQYSDDFASKDAGGDLGVLTSGMFPELFEEALYELDSGEISPPVKTEFGTHFIKAVSKTRVDVPALESQKERIAREIALIEANEEYSLTLDQLGELTFSSDGLDEASKKMNLKIQVTEYFDAFSGRPESISSLPKIREAAYSDDVKVSGHNSNVIEVSPERSLVIRVADIQDSFVKPLVDVREEVENRLLENKIETALTEKADAIREMIRSGQTPEALAAEMNYELKRYEALERSDVSVSPQILSTAFSTVKPAGDMVFTSTRTDSGDQILMGVTKVVDGTLADLEEGERLAIIAQLRDQAATLQVAAYFKSLYDSAEIELY